MPAKILTAILGWVMKSKGAKLGAGAISCSGLIAVIFNLNAGINNKIDKQDTLHKEYINLSMKPIQTEINSLKTVQSDIKVMVRDIHNYLLKTKHK